MATGNKDASLNDILTTPSLKTELAAVVALCSDAMRRELLAIFEPKTLGEEPRVSESDNDLLLDVATVESPIVEEFHEAEKRQKTDIQSPKTQGLRRAALTHFDKWQIDVLRRMGEVLSVRPDAVRKARANAKAQAEVVAKARREREYLDWANGVDREPQDPKQSGVTGSADALLEGYEAKIIQLSKHDRIVILESVLLLLLSLEHYTAHSRKVMVSLCRVLQLPISVLAEHESKVAEGLLASAAAEMSADESTKKRAAENASARRWKIGMATFAGAALIGVTGGLAAPILAAGIGSIMGGLGLGAVATLLGPLATNMVLVGGLFGAYGGKMTGRIMEKYEQEVRDFKFLPVASNGLASKGSDISSSSASEGADALAQLKDENMRKAHKLRVAIGISGSITTPSDFVEPWRIFSDSRIEVFGLRWETDALLQLSRKISEVLKSYAWDFARWQLLSMLLAGLWPFGLLRAASMLDSPFIIARTRADKAGRVLADALINRVQGERPVTLVGFSLGARVIYSCLLQLAEENAFGVVENVILMGAPTPSDFAEWRRIRAVVSGRVVNVYSANDYMLGFLYRASSGQLGIAGLQEVRGVAGVENFDGTDMVQGHDKYRFLVGTILQRVGFEDLDAGAVEQQFGRMEREQKQEDGEKSSQHREVDDDALAKEDGEGRIILVDGDRKGAAISPGASNIRDHTEHGADARPTVQTVDEEEEPAVHRITLTDADGPLSVIEPEPEPDYGLDRETVRFGSGTKGFNVRWDHEPR